MRGATIRISGAAAAAALALAAAGTGGCGSGEEPSGHDAPPAAAAPADLAGEILALGEDADWEGEAVGRLAALRGMGPAARDAWIRLLDEGRDLRVRRIAATELGGIPDPSSAAALARAARSGGDETLRGLALAGLGRLSIESAILALLDLVAELPEPWLREKAAAALAGCARAEDEARLVQLHSRQSAAIRSLLVQALRSSGGGGAGRRAAEALRDPALADEVRIRALELVAAFPEGVPAEVVLAEARDGPAPVRLAALEALPAVAGEDAYAHLRGFFEGDADVAIRSRALAVLGRVPGEAARDFLVTIARDRAVDPEFRAAAVDALGSSAGAAGHAALFEELSSREEPDAVRLAANRYRSRPAGR